MYVCRRVQVYVCVYVCLYWQLAVGTALGTYTLYRSIPALGIEGTVASGLTRPPLLSSGLFRSFPSFL